MNSIKRKVLIVPSWYPVSFVTDQMKLMEDEFDFKVIVGKRTEMGKRKALARFLSARFKRFSWNKRILPDILYDFFSTEYIYINALPQYFEKQQMKILDKHFNQMFSEIDMAGWTPDLIHIQSISDTAVFVCNWAEKNHIPVILTEHILYIRRKFDFFQKEKERIYSRVQKVLCVSNYLYRNLLTNGFKIKNGEIIGNYADDTYLPATFDKIDNHTRILFVATHLSDKDINTLFSAFRILLNSGFTNYTLDIIGLGPQYRYISDSGSYIVLCEEIERYGLTKHINIKGFISKEVLLKSFGNYSFLVSTSLSETFGLVIAEAIMYGLPVVCTDSGGIRDFVNESNGIVVPLRDFQLFSDAIKEMILNVDKYDFKTMSEAIRKKYGKEAFTRKLLTEYHIALQK
jgi:glycosyltransferase involved in cell wall biosynthesis